MHPKMCYTYVGIDSHKDSHTAVFLDCFFEKLGEITFPNRPRAFAKFLEDAQALCLAGTALLFGMEDTSSYGRTLMVFLVKNGLSVKHVNALLVARERKNQTATQKTDAIDAECAARVLLSKFGTLPDATPQDKYWVLRALVARRGLLVRHRAAVKNHLHALLTQHYPDYPKFFYSITCKTALAFFARYPSPYTLRNISPEELRAFLQAVSGFNWGFERAREILAGLQDTAIQFQEISDAAVRSTIRQLVFNMEEIARLDENLAAFLGNFDCPLTSMAGIDVVSAAKILACIGDIKKFATPAKLARYAGIAPVTYASGKRDLQFANERGNRELNSLFYRLAVRVSIPSGRVKKVLNSFFYDYYQRKLSEGKTKRQAIKCVERRLVNIIWTMLARNEEYVNPPTYELPEGEEGEEI